MHRGEENVQTLGKTEVNRTGGIRKRVAEKTGCQESMDAAESGNPEGANRVSIRRTFCEQEAGIPCAERTRCYLSK